MKELSFLKSKLRNHFASSNWFTRFMVGVSSFSLICILGNSLFENLAFALPLSLHRNSKNYVPGEIIVKFSGKSNQKVRKQTLFNHRALVLKEIGNEGLTHIRLLDDSNVEDAVRSYQNNSIVEFAQPNYIYKTSQIPPDDPFFDQEWAFKNTGVPISATGITGAADSQIDTASNTSPTAGDDIGIVSAWDYITDCSSTLVAILDTGINYNLPQFASNLWTADPGFTKYGYDFVRGSYDPIDINGHGTAVASVFGSNGVNGTAGVCWKAKIMAVRVMDSTGSGTTINIVAGINFAVNKGAKVINLSIGGSTFDTSFYQAISNAASKGVIFVTSAGNDGADNDDAATPTYPCSFQLPNLICVAALDQDFNKASFSNFGTSSVHLGAPGVNILTSWAGKTVISPVDISATAVPAWTRTSTTASTGIGWDFKSLTPTVNASPSPAPGIINPSTYNGTSEVYSRSTDDRIYLTYNLNLPVDFATMSFFSQYSLNSNLDTFSTNFMPGTGDPFGNSGIIASTETGVSTGFSNLDFNLETYDITSCLTSNSGGNCSMGFRLQSSSASPSLGAAVYGMTITTTTLSSGYFEILEGTSLAAPFVTGLVAMIASFNPNYTYLDVINSVLSGGVSQDLLGGQTVTGKSANAFGSLSFINPPEGISTFVKK